LDGGRVITEMRSFENEVEWGGLYLKKNGAEVEVEVLRRLMFTPLLHCIKGNLKFSLQFLETSFSGHHLSESS
jgi:hypothetical protein